MNTERSPTTFYALNLSFSLVRSLRSIVDGIDRRDRDLGKQLRRAATSVPLNLSEGRKRTGRDRFHLWRVAAGSAEEVRACLYTAEAWGYVALDDVDETLKLLDKLVAILWKLTRWSNRQNPLVVVDLQIFPTG